MVCNITMNVVATFLLWVSEDSNEKSRGKKRKTREEKKRDFHNTRYAIEWGILFVCYLSKVGDVSSSLSLFVYLEFSRCEVWYFAVVINLFNVSCHNILLVCASFCFYFKIM